METLTNPHTKSDMIRIVAMLLCCMMCCSVFLMTNAQVAYCTDAAKTIGDAVNTVATKFYSTARGVAIPIVICVVVAAAFYIVFGGNSGTDKARKVIFGAVAFLVLIIFAPVIGNELGEMFKSQGAGDLSTYNPLK